MREAEERLFSADAESWWDRGGPFRLLHAINPLRLRFAETAAGGMGGLDGKRLMDLGCGGGIFSEAAARAGARVVGADVNEQAIAAARAHADDSGLEIEYAACDSSEAARRWTGRFQVVTCFEMLEHAENPAAAVADIAAMLAPGGCAVFSTVNRTLRARALMIGMLERVLRILPHGAHDWRMFIRPAELAAMCRDAGLRTRDIAGMRYSLRGAMGGKGKAEGMDEVGGGRGGMGGWESGFILDRGDVSVNYFLSAERAD